VIAHEFDEVDGLVGSICGWGENAINAEAGLFIFLGNEAVRNIGDGGIDQLEEGVGAVWKMR
jgi:hypothetical protein